MKDLVIKRIEPALATDEDLAGCHEVVVSSRAVDCPADPPLPLRSFVRRMKDPYPGTGTDLYWAAYQGGEVVGLAEARFRDGANGHVGMVDVTVRPAFRRRGIGTALLQAVLPELRARDRRIVEGWRAVSGTAGQWWAEALGFRLAHVVAVQTLTTAEVDRSLWDVEIPEGYRLQRWIGAAPETIVSSYAAARSAIRDAPLGESEYVSPEWTADLVRATEAEMRQANLEQRVVAAMHEATGTVAGFTEIVVDPIRPDWAYQLDTAVLAAHRGRGLGRCLKAHMATWLLGDRPEIQHIRTTTGADNAYMMRVNHQVGYTTTLTTMSFKQNLTC